MNWKKFTDFLATTRNNILGKIYFVRNIVIWTSPFLLFLLCIFLIVFFLKGDFGKYTELLKILIWPATILLTLFFFRKVITYLFFTIDEFNFFGTKGELKDITQVIDERVERRLKDEKYEESRKMEVKTIAGELEKAKKSTQSETEKAKENFELAQKIFSEYQELSTQHGSLLKELDGYRQKEARIQQMRERIKRRREERDGHHNIEEKGASAFSTDSTNDTVIAKGTTKI